MLGHQQRIGVQLQGPLYSRLVGGGSDGDDAVTTARFTWNGHELLSDDTALFGK